MKTLKQIFKKTLHICCFESRRKSITSKQSASYNTISQEREKRMSIPKLILMDILGKLSESMNNFCQNDTVYHYTDLNAFINIFTNRELWISNINYMNDAEEFSNGLSFCKEVLEEYLSDDSFEFKNEFTDILNFINKKGIPELMGIDAENVFSLSFCHEGDLLTQWNCYGTNGVSIGFRNNTGIIENDISLVPVNLYLKELEKYDSPDEMKPKHELHFDLRNVIYDDDEKRRYFHILFDYVIQEARKASDAIKIFQSQIINSIYYSCIMMKNSCFSHEQEARIIIIKPSDAEVSYRTRKDAILPYIKNKILDLNCRPHKVFPVTDIVLCPNPNSEFTLKSVKYFLKSQGYDYLTDKVRVSDIPFRS